MTVKTTLACTAVSAGALLLATGSALAAAPVPTVFPHQHFVVNGAGERVPVGPSACEDGPSIAFDNFHLNVHSGPAGSDGRVISAPCPAP